MQKDSVVVLGHEVKIHSTQKNIQETIILNLITVVISLKDRKRNSDNEGNQQVYSNRQTHYEGRVRSQLPRGIVFSLVNQRVSKTGRITGNLSLEVGYKLNCVHLREDTGIQL